ncbi:hypothetical protein FOZ63_016019, partial [Perkinsus olseni]
MTGEIVAGAQARIRNLNHQRNAWLNGRIGLVDEVQEDGYVVFTLKELHPHRGGGISDVVVEVVGRVGIFYRRVSNPIESCDKSRVLDGGGGWGLVFSVRWIVCLQDSTDKR